MAASIAGASPPFPKSAGEPGMAHFDAWEWPTFDD
jgi:hypothetical protein